MDFTIVLDPIILDYLMLCISFKDCNFLYLNRDSNKHAHFLIDLDYIGSNTWLGHYAIDIELPLLDHHGPLSS